MAYAVRSERPYPLCPDPSYGPSRCFGECVICSSELPDFLDPAMPFVVCGKATLAMNRICLSLAPAFSVSTESSRGVHGRCFFALAESGWALIDSVGQQKDCHATRHGRCRRRRRCKPWRSRKQSPSTYPTRAKRSRRLVYGLAAANPTETLPESHWEYRGRFQGVGQLHCLPPRARDGTSHHPSAMLGLWQSACRMFAMH
ncbi:hypothetical protein B0H67DRAFT_205860 [Lasiosphaeris hirsuta]|uniref:Uncharacterized protein n=1 Tax=Lasiosphaeris hirsuta TaxID=260670 RepID=A0AA40ARW1_9PEZI|nr:hypothetical protein B0H67DRAFT_205860 [Lasiosphaeris hirsuta]